MGMGQGMIDIIKGSLGLVILEKWSILLQEKNITMHFLKEITNEMVKKFFLPLQTLELNNVDWGR